MYLACVSDVVLWSYISGIEWQQIYVYFSFLKLVWKCFNLENKAISNPIYNCIIIG